MIVPCSNPIVLFCGMLTNNYSTKRFFLAIRVMGKATAFHVCALGDKRREEK